MTLSAAQIKALRLAVYDPGAVAGRRRDPGWGVGSAGYAEEPESVWEWICRAVTESVTAMVAQTNAEPAEPLLTASPGDAHWEVALWHQTDAAAPIDARLAQYRRLLLEHERLPADPAQPPSTPEATVVPARVAPLATGGVVASSPRLLRLADGAPCEVGALVRVEPDAERVWMGDLAGFQLFGVPAPVVLYHRCGWTSSGLDGQFLANLVVQQALAHRSLGCPPRSSRWTPSTSDGAEPPGGGAEP